MFATTTIGQSKSHGQVTFSGVEKELIGRLEFVAIFYPTIVKDLGCSELLSKNFPFLAIPRL